MDSPTTKRAKFERRHLAPDREALIRDEHSMVRAYAEDHSETMCSEGVAIGELLDEVDALRAELDDARASIQTLVLREPAGSARHLLELRIREVVATSKGMGLSRGTCETLCEELLDETSDDVAALYRSERKEDMRKAEAAGYARATQDAKAFLAGKELAAHQAQMREAEAALYDARLRIGCGDHVDASEKGGENA